MSRKKIINTPVLLFLLSLILRLSLLRKGPFDIDCLNLIVQSQETLATLRLHSLYGTGYPLVVFLACLFIVIMKFIGITDLAFCVNAMKAREALYSLTCCSFVSGPLTMISPLAIISLAVFCVAVVTTVGVVNAINVGVDVNVLFAIGVHVRGG